VKQLKFITLLFIALLANLAKADSPLTFSPFSTAYAANKSVKIASSDGYYKKTQKALGSKKTSSLDKLLIINAIVWEKENNSAFEKYLISKRKGLTAVSDAVLAETDQTKLMTADDLIAWAYIKEMSDYQHPALATRAAYLAYTRDSKNMAYGVVLGLITAQKAFDSDWCDVYKTANRMIVETKYDSNKLKEEGTKIIMDCISRIVSISG
jgi:hypothetical protein